MLLTPNLGLKKPENNNGFGQDDFNSNMDVLDTAIGVKRAHVFHNVDQTLPNAAWTALAFNSERFDSDGMHDVVINNSRLTCVTAGLYLIGGNVKLETDTLWWLGIQLNGATTIDEDVNDRSRLDVNTLWSLAVGNYVELRAYQSSGGAVVIDHDNSNSPEFWAARLDS